MRAFLIGLQFLTRISLVRQTEWTEEDFGRSVRYFPAIGAVLGLIYVAIIFVTIELTDGRLPTFYAALIFLLTVALTGGIHCDGFIDTFDGLFSGRDRDRMLEIMKDSRVGAFGAVSFVTLALMNFAALIELTRLPSENLLAAIYAMPVVGRLMMVFVIGLFPYARESGMGKSFSDRTDGFTILFSLSETLFLLFPLNFFSMELFLTVLMSGLITFMFAFYFGYYATKKIGGVTGDIYGAVEIQAELIFLIVFMIVRC